MNLWGDVMRFAICDDEKIMQENLLYYVEKYSKQKNFDVIIDCFLTGTELLKSTKKYDIIFMDYQLEDANGIEISKKIRETNNDSVIIFVSSYPEIALDSFKVKTFRFLKKPLDEEILFDALDDYFREIDNDNYIFIKTREENLMIKMSEIIYAEGKKNDTIIRTIHEEIVVHMSIKTIEKMLDPLKFIRCQKAYITGFRYIKKHTKDEIIFDNGEKAAIGNSYRKKFVDALSEYIIRYNSRGVSL